MAKENVYGFQSLEVAQKLNSFAAQLGGSKTGTTGQGWSSSSFQTLFGEADGTITAASGDNLGTGTVKVETWNVNAGTVTRSQPSAAQAITVYNTEESEIASGTAVMVHKVASSLIVFPTAPSGGTGYGTLSSALATTDATASVTLDASSPLEPSASITATNWVDMEGASGAKCIVSKTGDEYILIQLACP
jgi:hypothetical protein